MGFGSTIRASLLAPRGRHHRGALFCRWSHVVHRLCLDEHG
jgi:hypothetical protein